MRQRLNHVVCLSLMRDAEAKDGIPYTVYARIRLDSMFFAPLPASVLELALVPGAAVVPTGDAWGGGREEAPVLACAIGCSSVAGRPLLRTFTVG